MSNIKSFQKILKKHNIDYYIVPTSDFHLSEYTPNHFKQRAFLSGFTGSAGTLVVSQNDAFLWTDGRYFIQAQNQMDKDIKLMKSGEENVPTILEFLISKNKDNIKLGFDGRLIDANYIIDIKRKIPNINLISDIDLVDELWTNRPPLPSNKLYMLDLKYAGEDFKSKINKIRNEMNNKNAKYHLLSTLDDQAWLYNLRGDDILYTKVFLAFTLITNNRCILFIDNNKLDDDIYNYLMSNDITVIDYNNIYNYLSNLKKDSILVDLNTINYKLYESIKNLDIINSPNPTEMLKAIKNDVEINNIKKAHLIDSIAMHKFMYYLKTNHNKIYLDELSLAKYLNNLRKELDGFIDLSFETISAFNENGAIIHYSPTPKSNKEVKGNGLLLVDSGAHYLYGTTDITRTYALGNITDEMKSCATAVLKGMIALSCAKFIKGTSGKMLDKIARDKINEINLDYKHGTGHGVGYMLSVHEGPMRISNANSSSTQIPFTKGMVTSNEPGIYIENKFGIRFENMLLCVQNGENGLNESYCFDTLTYVLIDKDIIDYKMLNEDELNWLNNYNKKSLDLVKNYLTEDELNWFINNI